MMGDTLTLTNKHGLPEAIVEAVKRHEHRSGSYSASMLNDSTRQLWLERRHEIVEDVADRLWALMGEAAHKVLEAGAGDGDLGEQYIEQEVFPGVTVSGTSDLYNGDSRTIRDYKMTSVWTVIYQSRYVEWERQLNVYAWLYRRIGFVVDHLEVVALLRDWQKSRAKFDPEYPQVQAVVIPLPLWNEGMQEKYVINRVALFEAHRETPDDSLPFCSPAERWQDTDKWAVMKKGQKRAVKIHDSHASAVTHAEEIGGSVEARIGEPRRCADYCPVAKFCNQYQGEVSNSVA